MALVLVSGTQLEIKPAKLPLNRLFLAVIGFLYLIALPSFIFYDQETNLERAVNLMVWFNLGFIFIIGFVQINRTGLLRYSKLSIGLLICGLLMTIPLLETQSDQLSALPRMIALWTGLFLFLLLQQFQFTNKQKQRLLWFLVFSSVIESLMIYLLTYFNWGHEDSFISQYHVAYLCVFPTQEALFSFVMTGLLASGYLLAREAKKYQLKISSVGLLYLTPIITIPIIVFINTYYSWAIFIITLGAIYPYLIRFSNHKRLITWSILLLTSLFISMIVMSVIKANLGKDEINHPPPSAHTTTSLYQALDMFIEKPFTGYGYGRFSEQYVLYSARQHQLNAQFAPVIPNLTHPQNELLFWGIEGGILPIAAIILAGLFVLIRNSSAPKGTRLATISLLLPIVLTSLFSDVLHQSHIHWISFIILLYWLDQRITKYRSLSVSHWRIIAISRTGMLVTFFLWVVITILAYDRYYLFRYQQTNNLHELKKIHIPLLFRDQILVARAEKLIAQNSLHDKSEHYIQAFLDLIRDHPTPKYYQILISLYQITGDKNKELQTRMEAKFLFPDMHFLLEGPSLEQIQIR